MTTLNRSTLTRWMLNFWIAAFLFLIAQRCAYSGDPVTAWTFDKLLKASDFVCIGTVKSTKVIENKDFKPHYLEGLESEVLVVSVLKGSSDVRKFKFRHFRFRQDLETLPGGDVPSFPVLRDIKQINLSKGKGGPVEIGENENLDTSFIFYLKLHKDDIYLPTSGHDFASSSVAQVLGDTIDGLKLKKK